MARTLDQQRAAFAWACVNDRRARLKDDQWKKYRELLKGAPSLIANSGLMPVLAFYEGKGKESDQATWMVLDDLIRGLFDRLSDNALDPDRGRPLFGQFMKGLQMSESSVYVRATDEALELLKWLRQFVDAVK